jgi:hypothetical protein
MMSPTAATSIGRSGFGAGAGAGAGAATGGGVWAGAAGSDGRGGVAAQLASSQAAQATTGMHAVRQRG